MTVTVPLELGECLGRGGEARVFAVKSDANTIAKLYHHPTIERADKLAVMIDHPPPAPSMNGHTVIAWPTRRIFAQPDSRRVAGFLMPRVGGAVPAANLHNMKTRLATSPHFNWKYIVRAAMNMALAVQKVHDGGYVIGDVNDQGILVAPNALVALVDCDSFQVADPKTGRVFRCPVGTGLFTPPELGGFNFATIDRTPNHDLFGLAVIVYQFLIGCHPFQVKLADGLHDNAVAIEDCIRRGLYPDVVDSVSTSPVSPPLEILPHSTRVLFRAAFGAQLSNRPTAVTWAQELWTIDRELGRCARNANHVFAGHLTSCPWCERTASLGGRDPFPSPDAIRAGEHLRRPSSPPRRWMTPRPRLNVSVGAPAAAGPSPAKPRTSVRYGRILPAPSVYPRHPDHEARLRGARPRVGPGR